MDVNDPIFSIPHEVNSPIPFEEICVTHVNGQELKAPTKGVVKLYLQPRITFRVECEELPKELVRFEGESIRITTDTGASALVFLHFSLNDLIHSSESFKGSFILIESPSLMLPEGDEVLSVKFGILNFQNFFGQTDKVCEINGSRQRLGSSTISFENYRVEITENPSFYKNQKLLEENDGYTITHTGQVERNDGCSFSVLEAWQLLRSVRALLSFTRGSAIGLAPVSAILKDGTSRTMQWGTTHTDLWISGSHAWLSRHEGADAISVLLPRFLDICRHADWQESLFTVIDWYLNSRKAAVHAGVILAQAALESFSFMILLSPRSRAVHEMIRTALEGEGISTIIPNSCAALQNWMNLRSSTLSGGSLDGPQAITTIRNDLVHPKKTLGPVPHEVLRDALRLSQWFIEMLFLKRLNYMGRYRNRVGGARGGELEYVPWKAP